MTESRRVTFLQKRIDQLNATIAELKAESDRISDQWMILYSNTRRSLLEDRLFSAVTHRQSRIPLLIAHAEREIEQFRVDLDRYYTKH